MICAVYLCWFDFYCSLSSHNEDLQANSGRFLSTEVITLSWFQVLFLSVGAQRQSAAWGRSAPPSLPKMAPLPSLPGQKDRAARGPRLAQPPCTCTRGNLSQRAKSQGSICCTFPLSFTLPWADCNLRLRLKNTGKGALRRISANEVRKHPTWTSADVFLLLFIFFYGNITFCNC